MLRVRRSRSRQCEIKPPEIRHARHSRRSLKSRTRLRSPFTRAARVTPAAHGRLSSPMHDRSTGCKTMALHMTRNLKVASLILIISLSIWSVLAAAPAIGSPLIPDDCNTVIYQNSPGQNVIGCDLFDCANNFQGCNHIVGTGAQPTPGPVSSQSCGCDQGQPQWADSWGCCDLWMYATGGLSSIFPRGECGTRSCDPGTLCAKVAPNPAYTNPETGITTQEWYAVCNP